MERHQPLPVDQGPAAEDQPRATQTCHPSPEEERQPVEEEEAEAEEEVVAPAEDVDEDHRETIRLPDTHQ